MNTFKAMFSIIFVIGMIVTIPIIQASETTVAITPESETLLSNSLTPQYLLFNTPKIGASQNSWDDYVASINWADYAKEQDLQSMHQLLYNTPRNGTAASNWNIYQVSINWADYIPSHSSSLDQLSGCLLTTLTTCR